MKLEYEITYIFYLIASFIRSHDLKLTVKFSHFKSTGELGVFVITHGDNVNVQTRKKFQINKEICKKPDR